MDREEFVRRLEAARARAALKRLEAIEALVQNVDLRENGDALTSKRTRQIREDGEVGMEPDPPDPPDPTDP